MSLARAALAVLIALALAGCKPSPPPYWQSGGAPLSLGEATWERADDDRIAIRKDGHVLEDGDLLYVIDRVGRVADEDYEPVALLLPEGLLVGTNDRNLGRIGVHNASPPGAEYAWVSVRPDGSVIHYDSDGDREPDGRWSGCDGDAARSCTLVTHLVRLRDYARRPRVGVGVGIGIGF